MKLANIIKCFVAGIVFKKGAVSDSLEVGDGYLYTASDGIYEKDSNDSIKGFLGVGTHELGKRLVRTLGVQNDSNAFTVGPGGGRSQRQRCEYSYDI